MYTIEKATITPTASFLSAEIRALDKLQHLEQEHPYYAEEFRTWPSLEVPLFFCFMPFVFLTKCREV